MLKDVIALNQKRDEIVKSQIESLAAALTDLQATCKAQELALKEMDRQLIEEQSKHQDLRAQYEVLRLDKDSILEQNEALTAQLESFTRRHQDLLDALSDARAQINDLTSAMKASFDGLSAQVEIKPESELVGVVTKSQKSEQELSLLDDVTELEGEVLPIVTTQAESASVKDDAVAFSSNKSEIESTVESAEDDQTEFDFNQFQKELQDESNSSDEDSITDEQEDQSTSNDSEQKLSTESDLEANDDSYTSSSQTDESFLDEPESPKIEETPSVINEALANLTQLHQSFEDESISVDNVQASLDKANEFLKSLRATQESETDKDVEKLLDSDSEHIKQLLSDDDHTNSLDNTVSISYTVKENVKRGASDASEAFNDDDDSSTEQTQPEQSESEQTIEDEHKKKGIFNKIKSSVFGDK